jgi:DNA-binding transcriptional LysR family regulator
MQLEQIRAFLAVVEARGFTRAAQVLQTTQPTLSRQVAALERDLGHALFDRLGRSITLTAFGERVLQPARQLLADADALRETGSHLEGRLTGELRLSVADSVVLSRLPRVLKPFTRRHPDITLHLKVGTSPQILQWVREGGCDVGLCMIPSAHPGLSLRSLWRDRFVSLVPPGHRLAGKRTTLAEFSRERAMVIRPGSLSHQQLTAAYLAEGLSLVADMDFDNFHLITEFVAAGVGVGISSETVARPFLKRGSVARARIPAIDRLPRQLGLALRAERTQGGAVDALIAEIQKHGPKKR